MATQKPIREQKKAKQEKPVAEPPKKKLAKVASEAVKGPKYNPTDPKHTRRIKMTLPGNMVWVGDGYSVG